MSSTSWTLVVFTLAGLISGLLVIPLGLMWMPSVFGCLGFLLALGLGAGYAICRQARLLTVPVPLTNLMFAGLILIVAYPLAIVFGGALALTCVGFLQWVIGFEQSASAAPLALLGLMLFWGSLCTALLQNIALMIVTGLWSNRVLLLLAVAGLITAGVSFSVYLPFYASEQPWIAVHREMLLFMVLAPFGNATFAAITGYVLSKSEQMVMVTAGHQYS